MYVCVVVLEMVVVAVVMVLWGKKVGGQEAKSSMTHQKSQFHCSSRNCVWVCVDMEL